MKGRILISLNKRFPENIYHELREKGFVYLRDLGWLIPLEKVEEFERIAGAALSVDEEELRNLNLLAREVREQDIDVEEKGESLGEISIARDELNYMVKLPNGRTITIPNSIVQVYREAVEELRRRGVFRIKKKELVEMVLRKIGFKKFFSRDGSHFYWETFYGDRVTYHTHYYYPVKILESMGLIVISKQDEIIIK